MQTTVLLRLFECKRDNKVIRGLVYRPSCAEGKLPVIICSHGYGGNHLKVINYAQTFAAWGFAAFCFDFCGSSIITMSDGKSTEMTINTLKEDLKAVIAYAKQQPYVDPNRLLLMGRSQGGLVTGLLSSEIRNEVAGQIQFFPGYNIPDCARRGWIMQDFDPENIPEVFPGGPLMLGRQYAEVMMNIHPWEEIVPFEGPVLLVHGTADPLVPVETSQKAYEVYTAGHPELHPEKKLVTIEGAVHGFAGEYDKIAIATMREFVDENFPGWISKRN